MLQHIFLNYARVKIAINYNYIFNHKYINLNGQTYILLHVVYSMSFLFVNSVTWKQRHIQVLTQFSHQLNKSQS